MDVDDAVEKATEQKTLLNKARLCDTIKEANIKLRRYVDHVKSLMLSFMSSHN